MLFLRACLKLRVVLPDRKWDSMQTYLHLWPTSLKSSNRKFLRIRTFKSKPVSALCWAGCGGDISLLSSLVIYWPIILIFICNKLNVCLYLNVFKCFNAHIDFSFFPTSWSFSSVASPRPTSVFNLHQACLNTSVGTKNDIRCISAAVSVWSMHPCM